MAQTVRETTTKTGNTVQKTTEVDDPQVAEERTATTAERVVWLIAGLIIALLAFRFVLSLLGANRENGFAELIFGLSYPFVAPFFTLFSYDDTITGASRFELYTLIAIAVYALIAWLLARVFTVREG